jgi:hypothetical protein
MVLGGWMLITLIGLTLRILEPDPALAGVIFTAGACFGSIFMWLGSRIRAAPKENE